MNQFTVELEAYEVEEGVTVDLLVCGSYAESPGNRRGHPDSWTPAWTELEIRTVRNARGCALPARMVEALRNDAGFLRTVSGAL